MAQALIVVKAATACDDELHDGLPSGVKKRKGFCRGICLRAVCCTDTQGLLGFPWPLYLKRGWAKTCATLPWPLRGWSLQVVLAVLTLRSQSEGAGVKAGTQRCWGARSAGLDAGASAAYRASPSSRKNRSGQPQARGAAPERRPPARPPWPWDAFHSGPIRGTQPGQSKTKRPTARSEAIGRAPSTRGMGGERKQWHGQSAAAPVPSFVSPLGGMVSATAWKCAKSGKVKTWHFSGIKFAVGLA